MIAGLLLISALVANAWAEGRLRERVASNRAALEAELPTVDLNVDAVTLNDRVRSIAPGIGAMTIGVDHLAFVDQVESLWQSRCIRAELSSDHRVTIEVTDGDC